MAQEEGVLTGIGGWIAQPFKTQMDLMHWVLFAIMLSTVVYLWVQTIQHIEN